MPKKKPSSASSPSQQGGNVMNDDEIAAAGTTATTTTIDVVDMSFPELEDRKIAINERLQEITIEDPTKQSSASSSSSNKKSTPATSKAITATTKRTTKSTTTRATASDVVSTSVLGNNATATTITAASPVLIPYKPKTEDTHWDYCLKEMMWLGADFQAERKRHYSLAKKCAAAVRQYHKTKESRRLRELSQAEMKRRKLAAKIGRDTRQWWTKIEKVIAYKQKLSADEERKKAMNKQLVTLVQQTEKYSELLSKNKNEEYDDDDDDDEEEDEDMDEDGDIKMEDTTSEDDGGRSSKQQRSRRNSKEKKKKKKHRLTIEEALAMDNTIRKSKKRIIDYSRIRLESKVFYGESTASDASGSDGSYEPESSDTDDESTLREAIHDELIERQRVTKGDTSATQFCADPEELRKLHEEKAMEIDLVLKRFQDEGQEVVDHNESPEPPEVVDSSMDIVGSEKKQQRKVQFAEALVVKEEANNNTDDGNDQKPTENGVPDACSSNDLAADGATNNSTEDTPRRNAHDDEGNDADDDGDASDVEDYDDKCGGGGDDGGDDDDDDDNDNDSDDQEFEAVEPEADDETTMIQEESLPQDMSREQEIDLLKQENELSIEELRARYAQMEEQYNRGNSNDASDGNKEGEDINAEVLSEEKPKAKANETSASEDPSVQSGADTDNEKKKVPPTAGDNILSSLVGPMDGNSEEIDDGGEGGGEYVPDEREGIDDETTIEAEEKMGRDMTYDEEINILQQESEIPVEQLRAMYAKMNERMDDDGEEDEDDDSDNKLPSKPVDDTTEAASSTTAAAMLDAYPEGGDDDDSEDYKLNEADAVDDETTIEIEERMGREMSHEEEMEQLKKENEIPVEKLREMYGFLSGGKPDGDEDEDVGDIESEEGTAASRIDHGTSSTKALLEGDVETSDADADEFRPDEAELIDDETTMEAEERLGREMSYEEELALLNRENEMSVEELRKMYAGINSEEPDADGTDSGTEAVKSEDKIATTSGKRQRELSDDESGSTRPTKASRKETANEVSDDGQAALDALEASAERARQTLATRPFLLAGWVKLRRYQQTGLNWLVSLQSRRLNGILADEMGLGKTLQTISLMAYLASYKGIWGPHLVVVPTSVIINWETELKRFCPALKVLCYYGSAKRRKELRTGWTKSNWYHVVITSYQLAVQDAFAFKRKKWYYLILDEAQNIKNFQSQRWQTLINFNTQRRLLLTGTPLQNNLMELWSLLHFLMPYIFRSRKEFSYWFSNPMNNIIEGNADRNDDVIRRLHGIIRPFVLRRLKKDVETQMPGKYEHIVKCQLSRRQMTLYEEFLSRSSTRQALTKGGNFMGMMNVLMQLRKVCNHPDLFEPRSVVTPFVAPPLCYDVPSCICNGIPTTSASDRLSVNLLQPLWCGSSGLPSVSAALQHGQREAGQLRRLRATYDNKSLVDEGNDNDVECPEELRSLLSEVHEMRKKEKEAKAAFHEQTNKWRCQASEFAYPDELQTLIRTEISVFEREEPVELRNRKVLLTPYQLLELRKTEERRADDLEAVIEKYVFCVPRAGAKAPALSSAVKQDQAPPVSTFNLEEMLLEPLEEYFRPFRKAHARLSSFFPDKKLVQYDAGKLQTLAELLHNLKRGGHRVLIFTQMSKMLDILEAFLNINGHTYLRLDGSTGVERRQRYMDRFNNDTKIFSFILSTRSGGMGINLTGADTVVFFDSDWNPAMDAQAQDRAHRIGQTRDVHIYRLITEHTIEENILMKAKQKRNLDIMVMDQGKFDASQLTAKQSDSSKDSIKEVFTKGGLRAILGVTDDNDDDEKKNEEGGEEAEEPTTKDAGEVSKEQMEQAMAELEDEDDVKALRGAQKEAAEEAKEFDETTEITKDSDGDDDGDDEDGSPRPKKKQKMKKKDSKATDKKAEQQESAEGDKSEENDLEKEFAAWQNAVGFDATAIEASLSPTERYALRFREDVDPFYSIFAINEQRRKLETTQGTEEIDITEIELEKAAEEQAAMDEGDLLATFTQPEDLVRQRNLYRREKARLKAEKKRRRLTGEAWSTKIDGLTKKPFWYNADTGEAIWDKPLVLIGLEAHAMAEQKGWVSMSHEPLVKIMDFLIPYPERQTCAYVCSSWRRSAQDIRFVRHVYPVEMGALSIDKNRREPNHFATIDEALTTALPGDTIELSDGHYWVNDPGLLFDKPTRLIGDEKNPSNVVVEMSGSVRWTSKYGWVEGVTFRRPKISTGEPPSYPMLDVAGEGKVDLFHCVFDNEGSTGSVVALSGSGQKGKWRDAVIRNGGACGVEMRGEVKFHLTECSIRGNKGNGIECKDKARFTLNKCKVENNGGYGIKCDSSCSGEMQKCSCSHNRAGVLQKESGCFISCSHNTAIVENPPKKQIPGFKLTHLIESEKNAPPTL